MMVRVGRHEWFVFRRYTEFDKLYNTVSRDISSERVHVLLHEYDLPMQKKKSVFLFFL